MAQDFVLSQRSLAKIAEPATLEELGGEVETLAAELDQGGWPLTFCVSNLTKLQEGNRTCTTMC